jgi:hypothetical protein
MLDLVYIQDDAEEEITQSRDHEGYRPNFVLPGETAKAPEVIPLSVLRASSLAQLLE